MPTGIVKWFNNAKGFGFIESEQTQEDIFVHYSAIEMDGFRTLKTGQKVEFELEKGVKGFHAANIRAQASMTDADIIKDSSLHPQTTQTHQGAFKSTSHRLIDEAENA